MKRLTAVLAALLTLVGLSGCGESFEKQNAEGTAYLAGLARGIPNAEVHIARYVVTGPGTINHNVQLELRTASVDPTVISGLLTQAFRVSVQTFEHQSGTTSSNFEVSVTDGAGTAHFPQEVGLSNYPSYPEVVEWLKTR
ncbi:MAG: hypothetical protein CVT62_03885 [Actinobacteria bacterium HGW-Actinobacteria-2]|nr:MAG: hypothetical protein CVT62_03885 [Actinobacteria bacterium HGW-Actinobacteria-2]